MPLRRRPLAVAAVLALLLVIGLPAGWLVLHTEAESGSGLAADAWRSVRGQGSQARSADDSSGDHTTSGSEQKADQKASGSSSGSRKAQGEAAKKAAASGAAQQTTAAGKPAASSPSSAAPAAAPAAKPAPAPAPAPSDGWHHNIVTTIFWVGEAADASNAHISNAQSAWDGNWQANFGGYDDPNSRNGYYPAGFVPRENPFYFALPYNDLAPNGSRKASAGNCPNRSNSISWCKNAWIKISYGGKVAYAQWEDVGPMQEDDTQYVFGGGTPASTWGAKAGLDVSPAVRDYLGLTGVNRTSWSFVPASAVPAGPWRNIVTTGQGGW